MEAYADLLASVGVSGFTRLGAQNYSRYSVSPNRIFVFFSASELSFPLSHSVLSVSLEWISESVRTWAAARLGQLDLKNVSKMEPVPGINF